jgi:hypothetical protein
MGSVRFTINAGQWYSWEMLPGYTTGFRPYCSPIYINEIRPLGSNQLFLRFYNAGYAEGVRNFELKMRVLKRAPGYLLAGSSECEDRTFIIGPIEFDWVRNFIADAYERNPPARGELISDYLGRVTGYKPSRQEI